MLDPERTVLLFYRPFEFDSYIRGDRHLKRLLRGPVNRLLHRPQLTGYDMWCRLLVRALERAGCDVRMNDYRAASLHPEHPVGLIGYPHLLKRWSLPNPAVLGPALHGHPAEAPDLMDNPRFRTYLVTCEWLQEECARYYGAPRVGLWHAGIDIEEWPDTTGRRKDIDVLIYDKVRWDRETVVPQLIEPIRSYLHGQDIKTATIRYGKYDHSLFAALLARSKSLLFLCEHETQGMAYQEAMASNVPVLAWDAGRWTDTQRHELGVGDIRTTSVPYFSAECGERFADLKGFSPAFERFWERRATYRPREYVRRCLSFEESAEIYLGYYRACGDSKVAHDAVKRVG